nr:O-antigen ligase family protein [Rhizobium giardinii]
MKAAARSHVTSPRSTVRPLVSRRLKARSRVTAEPATTRKALPWLVVAFLIGVFIPWLWTIGPLLLLPYRVALLAGFLPCMFLWLAGRAGRIRAPDILIILYSIWCPISLFVVHDAQVALQSGGIIVVETAGAYFLGRCFIRGPDQFYAMTRLLFVLVAIMLPFALVETITNANVSLDVFSRFFPTHPEAIKDPRWGLRRVQGVFEHPILFGVSCGAILALVHLVLGGEISAAKRWFATLTVLLTASLSLSSGPLTAIVAQVSLLFWNWLLAKDARRWQYLWVILLSMYAFIELASNQTVFEFLLTYFSFEPASAYYRVLIWEFGSQSALNHPIFGVGYGRWDRPEWMPPSIDMYWLYHAILFGIPAGIFMMGGFLTMVASVAFTKETDERRLRYRTAYLIVMTGYFLVGWTVHFWNATYVLFLFLLGSGSWLLGDVVNANLGSARTREINRSSRSRGSARDEDCNGADPGLTDGAERNPKKR